MPGRVVVRVEPPGTGDDSLFDEPIVRPTRLRSVGHGTMIWGGGERAWIAYVAPAGSPLPDVVKPTAPASWAETRPILEQLVCELGDGTDDGSSPDVLSPEQIWVEPNGRLQLVDFPMPTGKAVAAGETKSRYPGGSFTSMGFVKQVTALLLEGTVRTGRGRILAPLPAHASEITNRIFNDGYESLGELREDLAANQSQPATVTAGSRIGHLTLQGLLLGNGLFTMFLLSGFFNFFGGFVISQESQTPERLRGGLANGEQRDAFMTRVRNTEAADSPLRKRLEEAFHPDQYLATEMALKNQHDVTRAEGQDFLERLNRPEKYVLKLWTDSINGDDFDLADMRPAFVDSRIQAAKKTQAVGRAGVFRGQGIVFLWVFIGLILSWPLLNWPLFAFLFRGGIGYWFSGIALVRKDGRPAPRWRCAVRELLIWVPLTTLLMTALLLQWWLPTLVTLRSLVWLAGILMLPLSFVIALRDPTRSPVDRLVGVYLVPR